MSSPAFSLPKHKVTIIDTDQENISKLKSWFLEQPDFELSGAFHSPQLALRTPEIFSSEYALVAVDIPNGVKFCKILRKRNPSIYIIAIIDSLNAQTQATVRQAGASESLVRSAQLDLVGQTIRSVSAIEGSTLCSIVGIGGIKEGVGTTLLTNILGDFLGRRLPGEVLLVDLDFSRADLAFSLGEPSKKSLQELVALDDFLHPKNLQNYIKTTSRGFSLLSAVQEPDLKIVSDIAFVGLLTVLGNIFEVILIDLPPYPFENLEGVIDICDAVIINTGEHPNQLKSLYHMVNTDLKEMTESYTEKLVFTSWIMETNEQSEVTNVVPKCAFLPRPENAKFSDHDFTINDSPEFKPLRTNLAKLLEKIPGLSLYADPEVARQNSKNGKSTRGNALQRFFGSILE
ncbi:MAG: hypothetical protein ACQETH_16560 [Candidatus Rifleibacteriota bacterium]